MASINSYRLRYSTRPSFESKSKPSLQQPEKSTPNKRETSSEGESDDSSGEDTSSEEQHVTKDLIKNPTPADSCETDSSRSGEESDTPDTPPTLNGVRNSSSSEDSAGEESAAEKDSDSEVRSSRRPAGTMSSGPGAVPWRRPKLRKVGRKSAVTSQPTSDLPAWAADAKRRLGDVPAPLHKHETVESRPEWANRRVDMDTLEQLERRHLERTPSVPTQAEWSVPRLDAAAVGRLERAARLDKMASFEKTTPPEWADRTKSLDFSKLQELDTKARAGDKPSPEVPSLPWEEVTLVPPAPPPPPPPPCRPPLPPPLPERYPLTEAKMVALERIRKTARRRPDWSVMMQEITSAPERQLRHVQCRDRSDPIVHDVKRIGDEFIFESEKEEDASPSVKLMNDIKVGVKLKKVRCNDRSRPNLQGLRKLRRQRTSEAFLNLPPEELLDSEPEDLDDIDKIRDDLQSTRQFLGDEVKNSERLTKENKHLKVEMKRMQEEMEQLRLSNAGSSQHKAVEAAAEAKAGTTGTAEAVEPHELDEDLGALESEMAAMRDEAGASSREAQLWQERCQSAQQELETLRAQLEGLQSPQIGHKAAMENGNVEGDVRRNKSSAKAAPSRTRDKLNNTKSSTRIVDSEELTKDEEESQEESEEREHINIDEVPLTDIEQAKKKQTRELKMCKNKLSHVKTKITHAKNERCNLKNRIQTLNQNLKEEDKKYKELQREVKKMGEMLKENENEDDGSLSDEFNDESESESETETEEESSEESESESESDNEQLSLKERMEALQVRVRRHDDSEKVIKKGNYVLKTAAERLFDKLRSEKEKYRMLERELNDLVNELQ